MDPTLLVAIVGVAGTLLATVVTQVIDLIRSRSQFELERRKLRDVWEREDNIEKYKKLQSWVILAMKAIDPRPISDERSSIGDNYSGDSYSIPQRLPSREMVLGIVDQLDDAAAEAKAVARSDQFLYGHFSTFIEDINLVVLKVYGLQPHSSREPDSEYRKSYDRMCRNAELILGRISELMLNAPRISHTYAIWAGFERERVRRIVLWGGVLMAAVILIIVLYYRLVL